ncbi:MAG: DnaJ domain-containing protein [Candidatus Methylarchaceae archaeon HK02M2]|nr:DnaJ domain-containing protein [Candidatus Methylarchaceae archaeon HK02M2]
MKKKHRFKEDSIRIRAEQILGLDSYAKEEDIKNAYRKLTLRYHPDRDSKDHSLMRKMQLIVQAHDLLLKGMVYDDNLRQYELLEDDELVRSLLPEGEEPEPLGISYKDWHRKQFYEGWI